MNNPPRNSRIPWLVGLIAGAATGLGIESSLYGQERLATFDAPVVAIGPLASMDSLADLNGDGHMDAIGWFYESAALRSAKFFTHLNDGKGVFTEGTWFQPFNNTSLQSWALAVGRFNGDTRDDFVTGFNGNVTVYTSNAAGKPEVFDSWTTSNVTSAVVVDFDRDGRDDIVLAAGDVRFYRNTGSAFQAVHVYKSSADELFVGEFNGDSHPDLLLRGGTTLELISTRGTPSAIATFPTGIVRNVTQMVVVGDIDGDQDDDICVFAADGKYVVHRCTGPSTFQAETERVGGPATGLADIDGDGDLDGVCCGGGGPGTVFNTGTSTFHLCLNDGKGGFDIAWQIPSAGAKRLAGAVDIDGDGDIDLVAGRSVFFNQYSFVRDPSPFNRGDTLSDGPSVLDLDHDGDPDIVPQWKALSGPWSFWRNDGSGTMTTAPIQLPSSAYTVAGGCFGDYDGDGDLDAVVALRAGVFSFTGMRLLLNAGGAFRDGGWAIPAPTHLHSDPAIIEGVGTNTSSVDIDKDGDIDIIAGARAASSPILLWRNDGQGRFTSAGQLPFSNPRYFGDLDGDGNPDIVTVNPYLPTRLIGTVDIHFGDGKGGFGNTVTLNNQIRSADAIAIGDFDADGLPDIAVSVVTPIGTLTVWRNQGQRSFVSSSLYVGELADRIHAADVDGDQDLDLVLATPYLALGASRILFNDGQGKFATQITQVIYPVSLTDADGDGDLDSFGEHVARSVLFHGIDAGWRLQYGESTAGRGGAFPRLGASGPIRIGETMQLLLTGARPSSPAILLFGPARGHLPNWPAPGLSLLVDPFLVTAVLQTGAGSGQDGEGRIGLPLLIPGPSYGVTTCLQAFVVDDGAPTGLAQSNGLLLHVGR